LGTVYIGGVAIGTFPAVAGTSGNVYLGIVQVGDFEPLEPVGNVYLDIVLIGTYSLTGGPALGYGIGPTDLIYLEKLYEIRVHIVGGGNWNYSRFAFKDASWREDNPWNSIPIPGGTPVRQHIGSRSIEDGVLRCYDDKVVYNLFRNTDVRSDAGNQYLLAPTSYAATKVVFVYKGTNKVVSTGVESEDTVLYTFTNFRVENARSVLDENNQHCWEISFNADSVERSEP
jgi:hypothetical protein